MEKLSAFPQPANMVSHSSAPVTVYTHSHSACYDYKSFLSYPTQIERENENKKRSGSVTLGSNRRRRSRFTMDKCSNQPIFATQTEGASLHGKSYCPYARKPIQTVFSPILNPNSRTFWNVWKDSADRTTPPPGSSACRDGYSPCRACYTGVCRSRPGRTPIPDAISCSGS